MNIDDNKIYFLNNKDYGNENDNSSVIYTEINNNVFISLKSKKIEVIEQRNSYDSTGNKENIDFAVFMTSSLIKVIFLKYVRHF